MWKTKWFKGVLLIFLITSLLVGCSDKTTVTIGINNAPSALVWWVAEKNGYFEDANISVELKYFSVAEDEMVQFTLKNVDLISCALYSSMKEYLMTGDDQVILVTGKHVGDYSLVLKEKLSNDKLRIGIMAHDLTDTEWEKTLGNSDFEVVIVNNSVEQISRMLTTGLIDGYYGTSFVVDYITKEVSDLKMLSNYDEGSKYDVLLVREEWLRDNKVMRDELIDIWFKSLRYLKNNANQIETITPSKYGSNFWKAMYDDYIFLLEDENSNVIKKLETNNLLERYEVDIRNTYDITTRNSIDNMWNIKVKD